MNLHPTPLAGAFVIETAPHRDARGRFTRLYCAEALQAAMGGAVPVQINFSHTRTRGTLRGLHHQRGRAAEGKLIRCLRGAAWDVMVDLRPESPTFRRWLAVTLDAATDRQVWLPPGFAHGFQALSDDTELLYLHTAAHDPAAEDGLRWDDPALGIAWPLPVTGLSERDRRWPHLAPAGPRRLMPSTDTEVRAAETAA